MVRVDLPMSSLPDAWRRYPSVELSADALQQTPGLAVDAMYASVRSAEVQEPTVLQRVALATIVVAPTRAEVDALIAGAKSEFTPFGDLAGVRKKQFAALVKAANRRDAEWPGDYYGAARSDWRWIASRTQSVTALIESAVAAINSAPRGSRERHAMKLTQILIRRYGIDEFLDDRHGSRAALRAVAQRGALICLDETALFKFELREAVRELATGPRTAVASMSPCDPAHVATNDLLSESSFLFGALVTRFRAEHDPQCELSLNSQDRLLRWLKLAIPRLLTDIEGRTGRAALVDRADLLLETGGDA
jgi:hypothetical protein